MTKKSRVTRRRERDFKEFARRFPGIKDRKRLMRMDHKEMARDANVWAGQRR